MLLVTLDNYKNFTAISKENYKLLYKDFKSFWSSFGFKKIALAIVSRRLVFILIALLAFLLLKAPFELFVNNVLIQSVFNSIESNIAFDFLIFFLFLLVVVHLILRSSRLYRFSFNQLSIFIGVLTAYCFYRFIADEWVFLGFGWKYLSRLAYLDFILLPAFYPLFIFIFFHFRQYKVAEGHEYFKEDIPIDKHDKDIFGRKSFAEELAEKISAQKFKRSFAVGIVGQWGTGKSSFMHMIRQEMKGIQLDPIIVDFNAFYNYEAKDIIKEFFTMVSLAVKNHSGELSDRIINYRDYFLKLAEDQGFKDLRGFAYLINNERPKSVKDQYEKINKTLKRLGKQILVFIDDVDRLRGQEIVEILKIIRNTGDFSNTVYFVAFDKNYLINALANHTEYKDDKFVEKYFQYEFALPPISKEILRQRFAEIISKRIQRKHLSSIEEAIEPDFPEIISDSLFDENINTVRDITRLANVFTFEFGRVQGEVDVNDFLTLIILKSKFAFAYEFLSNDPEAFLDREFYNGDTVFQLKKGASEELFKRNSNHKRQAGQTESLQKLLDSLFPDIILGERSINHLSIRISKNFNRYFYLGLLSGDISNVEFEEGVKSDFSKFKESLKKWIDKEQEFLVLNRIDLERNSWADKKVFFNVFDALFFLGMNTKSADVRNRVIDVIGNIVDLEKLKSDAFIEFDTELGKRALYMVSSGNADHFDFESWFIFKLLKDNPSPNNTYWGISIEEFQKVQESFFFNYFKQLGNTDWHLYRIYHRCFDIGITDSINEKFKSFLKEVDYVKFLSDIINRDPFDPAFYISDIVIKIFGGYKEFGEFLHELIPSEELKEFNVFFEICSLYKFRKKIFFAFEAITLRDFGMTSPMPQFRKELFLKIKDDHLFALFENRFMELNEKHSPLYIELIDKSYIAIRDWSEIDRVSFNKNVHNLIQTFFSNEDVECILEPTVLFKRGQLFVKKIDVALIEVIHYQEGE